VNAYVRCVHYGRVRHSEIYPSRRGGDLDDVWEMPEKARRGIQAAAVEAYGRLGMYVVMAHVMRRANISDPEEFRAIAE
jgi:hypothetical protein